MALKFDLAFVVVSIAIAVLWIEHGHRVVIDAPAHAAAYGLVPPCPENDNMPYSASCIAFLEGRLATGAHSR